MEHITVEALQALLTSLSPKWRISPSVGRATLMIWDEHDEEIIGSIHAEGRQFVVEMHEAHDDRLRSGS